MFRLPWAMHDLVHALLVASSLSLAPPPLTNSPAILSRLLLPPRSLCFMQDGWFPPAYVTLVQHLPPATQPPGGGCRSFSSSRASGSSSRSSRCSGSNSSLLRSRSNNSRRSDSLRSNSITSSRGNSHMGSQSCSSSINNHNNSLSDSRSNSSLLRGRTS